jgi:hypothetical protein
MFIIVLFVIGGLFVFKQRWREPLSLLSVIGLMILSGFGIIHLGTPEMLALLALLPVIALLGLVRILSWVFRERMQGQS